MEQLVRTSLPVISKPLTDVIDDFVLLKRSIHTQIAYRNDIKKFLNQLNLVMLEDLAVIHFNELVTHLQKHIDDLKKVELLESRQRVINARTVNRKVNALRAFFKYLISVYGYPKNPLNQFNNLKTDNFSNTESLSRGEVIDLLSYAKANHRKNQTNFRNYLMTIFLFNLALRAEECSTLQWNDLDLAMQKASIYQKG
jgi:site-specific recombinase XerD